MPPSATSVVGGFNFQFASTSRRVPRGEVNPVNAAAFAYCKYAMLYFIALLVTWVSSNISAAAAFPSLDVCLLTHPQVPSTINRVYSLVYPKNANFALEFVSAFVLPLQGFWNSIIYVAISWSTIMEIARRWHVARRQRSSSSHQVNTVLRLKQFVTRNKKHNTLDATKPEHEAVSSDSDSTTRFARDNASVNRGQ